MEPRAAGSVHRDRWSIFGKNNEPAVIPLVPRTARTIDLVIGDRTAGLIPLRQDGGRLDRLALTGGSLRPPREPGSATRTRTVLGAAFIMCALEAGVPLRDVQLAARDADLRRPPPTTTAYDHRRRSFDRHAGAYVVPSWRVDDLPARRAVFTARQSEVGRGHFGTSGGGH